MFNRFSIVVMAMFLVAVGALSLYWKDTPGMELYSSTPVIKAHRMSQDLGGRWNRYQSLRQAWAQENRNLQGDSDNGLTGLIQADSMVLPSNQQFHVAVKKFSVTSRWGFKASQFVFDGVYGKAKIYLNGIEEVHFIGEFEGTGGTYNVDVSPARLNFGEENTLYIQLDLGSVEQSKLFGWLWPQRGRITGPIRLEAIAETTLDFTKTTAQFDSTKNQLIIRTGLKHHMTLEQGPWVINGTLNDQGQKVAECLLPIDANGEYRQSVNLVFEVQEPKFWSADNPYLYEVVLVLSNSRGEYDSIEMPIGLKKDSGSVKDFNEKQIAVTGTILSVEDSYQLRNQQQFENYLQRVKTEGDNTVYLMGFFPDEGWLYAADRLGVGLWLELPVALQAKDRIPHGTEFEDIIQITERHPSVMALTAGKDLEPSAEAVRYYEEVRSRVPGLPIYHFVTFTWNEGTNENRAITLEGNALHGNWGTVTYNGSLLTDTHFTNGLTWQSEKTAAIIWLIWVLLVSIQNFRAVKWNYRELFNHSPKRAVRRSYFWGCLAMMNRYATLGAVVTSLLFTCPLETGPWIPYDLTLLLEVRNQSPYLLWLLMASFLILFRLFQTGLAGTAFPQNPRTFGLACYLERRYNWIYLVCAAWVMTLYGMPWYLPAAVYTGFSLVLFPLRVRDVWKAKGKYRYFIIIPMTFLVAGAIIAICNIGDLRYLIRMIMPGLKDIFL